MCKRTSPFAGAYTGASSSFKLWSFVTCSDGFGNGVDIVCRDAPLVFAGKGFKGSALEAGLSSTVAGDMLFCVDSVKLTAKGTGS